MLDPDTWGRGAVIYVNTGRCVCDQLLAPLPRGEHVISVRIKTTACHSSLRAGWGWSIATCTLGLKDPRWKTGGKAGGARRKDGRREREEKQGNGRQRKGESKIEGGKEAKEGDG